MKRQLAVLLCAFTLAAFGSFQAVRPAHAVGVCQVGDQDGNIYEDGYVSVSGWEYDGWYHYVNMDLKAWRLPLGSFCYRAYYFSMWTGDGVPLPIVRPYMRTFVCGGNMADFALSVRGPTTREWFVTRGVPLGWGQNWGSVTRLVFTPGGDWVLADFAAYSDGQGCYAKQASNISAYATNGSSWLAESLYRNFWYIHFNVP